jgi:nitrate reductase cytochrome c-type subunit
MSKTSNRVILLIISVAIFAGAAYYVVKKNPGILETEKVLPLTKSWEKVIPHQQTPQGLVSLRAKDCGTCHVEHYKEWQTSTHAQAWKDLQFQAELKKESSPFMCINCHIPLQNQQEYIIKGLINGDIYRPVKEKNPHFDKEMQDEGINCASCHVRNNTIIGPTGSALAPHPVKKDPIHLSEKLCISCHNANAVITPTLACTFQTGDEWKAGPYYGKKNCISCHMPETHRPVMEGFPARKSRFHNFPASGIPKFDTLKSAMLKSLEFYPSKIAGSYKISDSLKFSIKLRNEHAGHRVPTGDPERFILVDILLKDITGKVIAKSQGRIGEAWEWHPAAKKLSDNNLNPGESRDYSLKHKLMSKGKYSIDVKITKHRISDEAANYNKLGKNYPRFIVIYEKTQAFEVK